MTELGDETHRAGAGQSCTQGHLRRYEGGGPNIDATALAFDQHLAQFTGSALTRNHEHSIGIDREV